MADDPRTVRICGCAIAEHLFWRGYDVGHGLAASTLIDQAVEKPVKLLYQGVGGEPCRCQFRNPLKTSLPHIPGELCQLLPPSIQESIGFSVPAMPAYASPGTRRSPP